MYESVSMTGEKSSNKYLINQYFFLQNNHIPSKLFVTPLVTQDLLPLDRVAPFVKDPLTLNALNFCTNHVILNIFLYKMFLKGQLFLKSHSCNQLNATGF